MAGPEILRGIVVKISSDKKKLRGTGFFVSDKEIVTCHHVLADRDGRPPESYFVKNDDWDDWVRAEPIEGRGGADRDFAFLSCPAPIKIGFEGIRFKRWDERHKEFFSRGYDCNTSEDEGASSVEGEDCRIVDRGHRGKERRWQLSSLKKSLLPGRSGSPVWSVWQRAIVGMIDYRAGDENILRERSLAIPIEEIFPDLPAAKGQPINAPKLPADFLDRPDDLLRLKEMVLSHGESSSAITGKSRDGCQQPGASVGLQGMGGIGKSVLAAALAWDDEVLEAFPDGVIWIPLGQQPDLASRQLQLIRSLEMEHRAISDVQDGLSCLRQILRDLSCLIILDDVWSMESIRAFDALGPDCRLLITTRDREIVRGMKARELCLDFLDEEEALQLLALSSRLEPEELGLEAREVAEECDRLPLALTMVGSMARSALDRGRSDPWKHILHRLRSADLDKIKAEFPDYPYPNLLRAIEVSVESLEPEEQRRYLDLAVFPEDEQVPEAALQLIWELDEYDTRDMADLLADRSLARFISYHFGMHDLLHDFAVKKTGDLLQLHWRLVEAYKRVCPDGWHTGPDDGYFYQHLAYHLLHSGRKAELKELALDIRWLEARLEKTDITSLISDYDLMPEDEELKLLQDGLRLSSHVLFRDSSQLSSQLLARMLSIDLPGINRMIKQAVSSADRPWLRPMNSSLNPPGGPLIRTLTGHISAINAVALTSDGQRSVSGSNDRTLKVWDLESGRVIRTLEGHTSGVNAVALTSDGRWAVSASDDHTLKVWDLESGRVIRTLEGHTSGVNAVALTSDGRWAVSASDDHTLKVWDLENGRVIRTLKGHIRGVNAVALTSDGRRAVSASDDHTLKVWDLESSRVIRTLESNACGINAVTLTSDGRRAVSASDDHTLKIWGIESGRWIRTPTGHDKEVNAIALTSDGKRAVSASDDHTLKIWDLESGRVIKTLEGHAFGVNAVALTSDGRRAVSASVDGTLKVWDIERRRWIRTSTGHDKEVSAIALTSDGRRAISGSFDCTLKVWDTEAGRWIRTLDAHALGVNAVALTSDGRRAVSASVDGTLKVWDLGSYRVIRTLEGYSRQVKLLALTSDGMSVVWGSVGSTFRIWSIRCSESRGTIISTVHCCYADEMLALTSNGSRVVSKSFFGHLVVWDIESPWMIRTLESHARVFNAVALTSDGRRAVSASDNRTLTVWDLERGKEIRILEDHAQRVRALALTSDGRRAVSASQDRTLTVLDLESGKVIARFTGESAMLSCAISSDGLIIVAGEASGRVHLLRLEGLPQSQDAESRS